MREATLRDHTVARQQLCKEFYMRCSRFGSSIHESRPSEPIQPFGRCRRKLCDRHALTSDPEQPNRNEHFRDQTVSCHLHPSVAPRRGVALWALVAHRNGNTPLAPSKRTRKTSFSRGGRRPSSNCAVTGGLRSAFAASVVHDERASARRMHAAASRAPRSGSARSFTSAARSSRSANAMRTLVSDRPAISLE